MKTNYFFLLFFLLILMGCSDDKNIPDIPASTEDTYEGVHDLISFTKETGHLQKPVFSQISLRV